MKTMRTIIEIDDVKCTGCERCVPACEEGAIRISAGKARVISEQYCDGLGACIGECPEGAIRTVQRMAEPFDTDAVKQHRGHAGAGPGELLPCGCPSAAVQTRTPATEVAAAHCAAPASALGNWPVQIRLIPAHAPFLKQADLLILADCAAVAHAGLHHDLLPGRVVLMGCPKFDDLPQYERQFADIFTRHQIKSVTTLIMEVPCCSGLPAAVRNARNAAGRDMPLHQLVVGRDGSIAGRDVQSCAGWSADRNP